MSRPAAPLPAARRAVGDGRRTHAPPIPALADDQRRQEATVTGLAEWIQLAQSTVTEFVDRAVNAGLIQRQPSDLDRRSTRRALTSDGDQALARTFTNLAHERSPLANALQYFGTHPLSDNLKGTPAAKPAGRVPIR